MRILSRYILKEIVPQGLFGLLVFTFVIFVPHVGHLLELVVRHDLGALDVLRLFVLPIPGILVLTIPMAVLVGTLIGLSRMAADGEVIAVRASGIGLSQFVRPVVLFALMGWGATSWMSLTLAPQAGRELNRIEAELRASHIPYEIQPRVFIEQFPNLLVYIQDVSGSHLEWKGVFIADTTQRDSPKITLAETGILVNDAEGKRLLLHLDHGATHEIDPQRPQQYAVASFNETDLPISMGPPSAGPREKRAPALASLAELVKLVDVPPERKAALVELHYRLALPVASVVLALVGIPLGIFSRKGGKASGVTMTIFLVFLYYVIMAAGLSLSRQGRLDPAVGLWLANAVFGISGLLMLVRMRRVRLGVQSLLEWIEDVARRFERRLEHQGSRPGAAVRARTAMPEGRFFQILDAYVIRSWLFFFVALLVTFIGIYIIFDFFQLLSDIIRNHAGGRVVFNYYRYLFPQVAYLMLPLALLVATLINFGLLTRTNQIVAIKSVGISIYRTSVPVLLAAMVASAGMFLLGDAVLPETNQRQDSYRNRIKGRPAQTYYRPDRQWFFGQSSRIYNYRYFDGDRNVFGELSIFEFDSATFRLTRRIYAHRAFWEAPVHAWVMEQGWSRDLEGERVASYLPFAIATFPELTEEPAYFKKEVKPSAQMSALELRRYIGELSQSGFDVVRLSVQFYRKFSYPLMAFVVCLIGIPFSLTTGSRGAISGFAVSVAIAIVYWATASLFEAMGNLSQLSPALAAWAPDALFGLGGTYLFLRVRT